MADEYVRILSERGATAMPLPGGPSDKLGNRYELWWTVSQLVRIMDGQAESIRIEDPNVDKAEFVITVGDQRGASSGKA